VRRALRTLALLVSASVAAGCYRYVPVQDAAPLPERGEGVRVELTSPQPLGLGTITVNDITVIEGDVYRTDDGTLGVFSRRLYTSYGFRHDTDGAVFYVTPGEIRRLEVRRLQPAQTAVTAVLVAGGAVLAFDMALRAFGGGGSPGNDDNGPVLRLVRP
jgi:hypothetical protein